MAPVMYDRSSPSLLATDYSVQTMSMASVLDPSLHERFKRRVAIKPSPAPPGGGALVAAGGASLAVKSLRSGNVDPSARWMEQQLMMGSTVRNNRLPQPRQHLTGRNALTRAQEVEWRLADSLPALATHVAATTTNPRKDAGTRNRDGDGNAAAEVRCKDSNSGS